MAGGIPGGRAPGGGTGGGKDPGGGMPTEKMEEELMTVRRDIFREPVQSGLSSLPPGSLKSEAILDNSEQLQPQVNNFPPHNNCCPSLPFSSPTDSTSSPFIHYFPFLLPDPHHTPNPSQKYFE